MHCDAIEENTATPSLWMETASTISATIYTLYFKAVKCFVEALSAMHLRPVGVSLGMLFSEFSTLAKASYYHLFRYTKVAQEYGLNQVIQDRPPVLLLHGAAGSWSYLHDLAQSLKAEGFSVFVMSLGSPHPTEEKREIILQKIEEIRDLYEVAPQVDLVAHSMGGYLALYSTLSQASTTIDDEKGEIVCTQDQPLQIDERIGRVVTLAMPYDAKERDLLVQAGKVADVYNVLAEYDALMGHKACALDEEHAQVVNAGHIGIVFQQEAHQAAARFLCKS